MADYECHITLIPKDDANWVRAVEEASKFFKFKTSFIVGDPVLGKAKYFYCTGHDNDFERMKDRMYGLSRILPSAPVRLKIEHIIFDERIPYEP